ncbi:Epididymal-specific lipocalin-6 [Sciurus carolinensis]|uniref:Epididymal-specific lipocalin-6 n=1 Tax=Sciurus carolinensis TaxID=30640 RepID=A0AA41NEL3_SCICA|nr:Epididymal-specific lipocalin-6 [Sciurus carolinensis]
MRVVLLGTLLLLVSVPSAQLVWLGRLDPKQEKGFMVEKSTKNIEGVMVTLTAEQNLKLLSSRHGAAALLVGLLVWAQAVQCPVSAPNRRPTPQVPPFGLLHVDLGRLGAGFPGNWGIRAVCPLCSLPGWLTTQGCSCLSLSRLEGCIQSTMELSKQNSRWVFENPSLGVLQYRVLGTNFRDYAIILTQLELEEEDFNTLELYSRTEMASQEALQLFTKWSRDLGFLSQQQAQLQKDFTCAHRILQLSYQLGRL